MVRFGVGLTSGLVTFSRVKQISLFQFVCRSITPHCSSGRDQPVHIVGTAARNRSLTNLNRPFSFDISMRNFCHLRIGRLVGSVCVSQYERWDCSEDVNPGRLSECRYGGGVRRGILVEAEEEHGAANRGPVSMWRVRLDVC